MNHHEEAFVKAFIIKPKQERMLALLANPRRRAKITARLAHHADLDPRYSGRIPSGSQSTEKIYKLLRSKGAPTHCHIISQWELFDGKYMPLADALGEIVGMGMGTLISCVPGILGYYESEEVKQRFVLERPVSLAPKRAETD